MSVNIFIVANVTNNGQPSNYRTVCRVLAIAALLQGWLCVGVLCTLQMCCNVRSPMRDFELSILSLEGEWDAVLGLRTTYRALCRLGIRIPSAHNRC